MPTNIPVTITGIVMTIVIAWMFSRYELKIGLQTNSPSLVADSRHILTDFLSSLVILAALAGSTIGFALDRYAAVVVVLFIGRSALTIFLDSMRVLLDASLDYTTLNKIRQTVLHPKLRKSLVGIGMIRNSTIKGDVVGLTLALKSDHGPLKDKVVQDITHLLTSIPGVTKVDIDVATLNWEESELLFPHVPLEGIEKIGRFIAVASRKGGVGKTTIAVNLSVALSRMGYRTGLLDVDIYGPSVPLMLGLPKSLREEGGMILPCDKHGLRVVSLCMTAGETDAFIWRGLSCQR